MVTTQQINDYLNKLPDKIKNAPKDEQFAYYAIILGVVLVIIGVMLWEKMKMIDVQQ